MHNSLQDKKITIIGLGLIGGSLARALNEKLGIKDITAINRSQESIDIAINDGTIARGFKDLNDFVFNSDIIFICTPVKRTLEYIDLLAEKVSPHCIITDVGSTKSEILNHVNKMSNPPVFIGGHPMAGTEQIGYTASFSHLFENAYYILTPGISTTDSALELMTEIITGIAATPVILSADEHDKITGCISHVPHVISSALVNMVKNMDTPNGYMKQLAAGGFKDITRIASSSPEMWENIILSNKEKIKGILQCYVEVLHNFIIYIDNDDKKSIFDFFDCAKNYRNTFSNTKKGSITPNYEIIIDVKDEPGVIGEIATILGENGINIKNINISNSREFEEGCLKVTLTKMENVNISFDILTSKGYKVFKN